MLAAEAAIDIPRAVATCTGSKEEIVVCGSRGGSNRYRLPPPSPQYEKPSGLPRAEAELIPGIRTSAHVDRVDLAGGNHTNRAMVTFTVPF